MSLRDAEDLLAERGIDVTYETVRFRPNKFGTAIAANIRRRRGRPDCVWHLDEMVVRIGGKRMSIWRAVDKEGEVLDILDRKRRNLLKKQGFVPEAIVTDGLASYRAALRNLGILARHQPGRQNRDLWLEALTRRAARPKLKWRGRVVPIEIQYVRPCL